MEGEEEVNAVHIAAWTILGLCALVIGVSVYAFYLACKIAKYEDGEED